MKTFDDIVDELFKPDKLKVKLPQGVYSVCSPLAKGCFDPIEHLAEISKKHLLTCYGADVSEPIITVCKLMLERHSRFHLEKGSEEKLVIVDKFTKQKFVCLRVPTYVKKWCFHREDKLVCPSFLTEDENKLLGRVMTEWSEAEVKILADKRKKREQKRKDKHRQEMINLYKEDM